jgi:acetamidase/formamidase
MDVVLKIDVLKGRTIDWPSLEDANHIMVVGSGRSLIDAFRLAHVELIERMEQEYGFDRLDAHTLVGQVGESAVVNIVDPEATRSLAPLGMTALIERSKRLRRRHRRRVRHFEHPSQP